MPNFQLTPDILAMIAGVVLSLLFSYIPGLSTAFAALKPEVKRVIMLALLLLTSVVVFLLGCYAIIQPGLTCDKQGAWQLVWMLILAIIANQSTFLVTPQLQSVKDAKPPLKLPLLATASGEPVGPAIKLDDGPVAGLSEFKHSEFKHGGER